MSYFIIILNWNGFADTKKCIESIINEQSDGNYTIIVVDNGSNSQEVDLLSKYCNNTFEHIIDNDKEYFLKNKDIIPHSFKNANGKNKVILIRNNENLGFANGNNVALKFLQNINARYALLLNNDTEVEGDALSKMFNYLTTTKDDSIAAVVPQIRYYNPNNLIWNCGGSINWLGLRRYHYAFVNVGKVPKKGFKQVDYGTGCSLLMDLSKTGLLSDKFFFGEEDMELALRLKSKRMKIICLFDAIVYHKVAASRIKISNEKMGNMVFHYSMRMSNLKDYLPCIVWYMSFIVHYVSTIRILMREKAFSLSKVNAMWCDVYQNVKNISKFEREHYLSISRKKY